MVGGFHGNSAPSGSSITTLRPSVLIVPPSSSTITSVGMPLTLYFLDSDPFFSRSA